MSERRARGWQSGALPSTAKALRTWRTREDPFADVWESELVPQLVADTNGRLQVLTLFRVLCRRHPGRFQSGRLRTLQRRVRDWRVQYGADREVYFEQVAVPGREAAFDFTDASDLAVTIRGGAISAPAVRVGAELQQVDATSGCLLDEQVGDLGRRLEDGAGLAKDEVIDLVSGDRSLRGAEEHAAIRRLVRRIADMLPFTTSIGATQLPPADVAYREYVPALPRQAAPSHAKSRHVTPSQAAPWNLQPRDAAVKQRPAVRSPSRR